MIKLINTTSTTLTEDETIPLNLSYNTNGKTGFSSNAITINEAGYYDVDASFIITATVAGDITISVYANGTELSGVKATETFTAIGDTHTFTINDIVRILKTLSTSNVTLTFVVSGACTLVNANVSVFEIK